MKNKGKNKKGSDCRDPLMLKLRVYARGPALLYIYFMEFCSTFSEIFTGLLTVSLQLAMMGIIQG